MIYVHIPFCGSFCTYCGFYSETISVSEGCFAPFCRALDKEISLRTEEIRRADSPDTLYIGGGTPSVLPPDCISGIAGALAAVRGGNDYEEFTVEVNPEDISEKGAAYVNALAASGVTRISMGVQSLDDGILKWMNRRHDAETARRAYRILREAGIGNVSVDLIFGISDMSDEVWLTVLDEVVKGFGTGIPPEHISAYQLSVEEDSTLCRMVISGKYTEASDDRCCRQYGLLCRILSGAGYRHYEISNFARPGYEAVHNSGYWSHRPYVGLGPAAHSFSLSGRKRSWNDSSLSGYLSDFSGGHEYLTDSQMAMERIMLSLRTDRGISEKFLRQHSRLGAVDAALEAGWLVPCPKGLRIPEDHFFVSDNIISDLV